MIVTELIEQLKKCEPQAEVQIIDKDTNIIEDCGYQVDKILQLEEKDSNITTVYIVQE